LTESYSVGILNTAPHKASMRKRRGLFLPYLIRAYSRFVLSPKNTRGNAKEQRSSFAIRQRSIVKNDSDIGVIHYRTFVRENADRSILIDVAPSRRRTCRRALAPNSAWSRMDSALPVRSSSRVSRSRAAYAAAAVTCLLVVAAHHAPGVLRR
jgi:hypothetical protein